MTTDELADKFMEGLVCKFVERKDIVELIELAKDSAIVEVVEHLQKTKRKSK